MMRYRMMKPLKIGDLTVKIPLLQGGMGIGVSLGGLAGAVAKEGGIGVISTAQIGYREPDFDWNTVAANNRAITKELKKAREKAPDGIIGANIMVALKEYQEHVKTAVATGADIIISGAGLPTELPRLVGTARTKIAPIVSSAKSIQVILKYWDKKCSRTADLVVIEGPKAGGHLGFKKEDLNQLNDVTYLAEIKQIIQVVHSYAKKYKIHIPVILGGGIHQKKDVQAAFQTGADGVQVATRFIPTNECDAAIKYKEAYINIKEEDIAIVKSPVGMPGRGILNTFMKRVMAGEKIPHSPCHQCLVRCSPMEIPYCITDSLIYAVKGDVEKGLLFSGAYGYKMERIETVKEVVKSLF